MYNSMLNEFSTHSIVNASIILQYHHIGIPSYRYVLNLAKSVQVVVETIFLNVDNDVITTFFSVENILHSIGTFT